MISQYAVPDTVAVESSMLLSLALSSTCPWPRAILSNFFEKPPTIPFGIVACTFPTNFLEIAVYLTYAAFRAHAGLTRLTDIL